MLVAVLDQDNVLVKFKKARKKDLNDPSLVLAPDGCDLKLGDYKWDGEKFVPINLRRGPREEEPPSAMGAIAHGLAAIDASGKVKFPDETKNWLNWFRTTKDGIAPPPSRKRKPRKT